MQTILISGSGTGVGKTRVTAALARTIRLAGRAVQIIKPVETGISADEATDADTAAQLAGIGSVCAYTLRRFSAGLAPLAAASASGSTLDGPALINEIRALPGTDVRLIEGAGGLAVPLGKAGWDWADFAAEIQVDGVVLVVPDELGAINQSRLVLHYLAAKSQGKLSGGIFLNALRPAPADVRQSTRNALMESSTPLWGELSTNSLEPVVFEPLTKLLGE